MYNNDIYLFLYKRVCIMKQCITKTNISLIHEKCISNYTLYCIIRSYCIR